MSERRSAKTQLTAAQLRAVLKALQLSRGIVQGIAAEERMERRRGAGRDAESAIDRAERLLMRIRT